jgi:carbon-monoxide dehydrogenase small subunit
VECEGRSVDTIEAVAETPAGRLLVDEFERNGAVQCGICTPGFVVTATAALDELGADPDDRAIRDALAGNLCRCTGYVGIVESVRRAAETLHANEANDE